MKIPVSSINLPIFRNIKILLHVHMYLINQVLYTSTHQVNGWWERTGLRRSKSRSWWTKSRLWWSRRVICRRWTWSRGSGRSKTRSKGWRWNLWATRRANDRLGWTMWHVLQQQDVRSHSAKGKILSRYLLDFQLGVVSRCQAHGI